MRRLRRLSPLTAALWVVLVCWASPARADVGLSADSIGRYEMLEMTVSNLFPETFPDVPEGYWAFDSVGACVGGGIVGGYPDGLYRPSQWVDRAQMAAFISRALAGGDGHIPSGPAIPTFADVPEDHWAFRYVEYAAANNIVEGYAGDVYRPDWTVDRGQMAVFIARSIVTPTGDEGLADYAPPETPTFPDVTADGEWAWCHAYVEYIAGAGITQGYEDGLYHPERDCARDQMAVYVQRAFDLPPSYGNPFDPAEVNVVAEFRTPSDSVVAVPGFYYVPYERSQGGGGEEALSRSGEGVFKARFSPHGEVGRSTRMWPIPERVGPVYG